MTLKTLLFFIIPVPKTICPERSKRKDRKEKTMVLTAIPNYEELKDFTLQEVLKLEKCDKKIILENLHFSETSSVSSVEFCRLRLYSDMKIHPK